MEKFEISKEHNLFLLEDCSQAHGAAINGKSVGSFQILLRSFCNDKIISTGGEGGMITTNNRDLYQYVLSYRNHGKVQNKRNIKDDYLYNGSRFNYVNLRLTEMQSAIGLIQLKKLIYGDSKGNIMPNYLLKLFKIFLL